MGKTIQRWIQNVVLFLLACSIIISITVTMAQCAIYNDFNFYQKEYEKYNVQDDLNMEMNDIMHVTREMMAFLTGEREDLTVYTKIEGKEAEFFNENEKSHMDDVKTIFMNFLKARMTAIIYIIFVILLVIVALKIKLADDYKELMTSFVKTFFLVMVIISILVAGLAIVIVNDFSGGFTIMHQLIFDNDLWLMDPDTDMMIRMLPEGFFYDMAVRIVKFIVCGIASISVVVVIAHVTLKKCLLCKRENNNRRI